MGLTEVRAVTIGLWRRMAMRGAGEMSSRRQACPSVPESGPEPTSLGPQPQETRLASDLPPCEPVSHILPHPGEGKPGLGPHRGSLPGWGQRRSCSGRWCPRSPSWAGPPDLQGNRRELGSPSPPPCSEAKGGSHQFREKPPFNLADFPGPS